MTDENQSPLDRAMLDFAARNGWSEEMQARLRAEMQWERDRTDAREAMVSRLDEKRAALRKDMADGLLLATCDPRLRLVK